MSTADLLVIVLVADAAQNAMAAEYKSITEGIVLVATIFAWNYALDWLGYRYRWVYRLLHPAPLLLVKDGRVQRRNLRSELLTLDDLREQLREQGIDDVGQVKRCYLEADGHLSVIRQEPGEAPPRRKESAAIRLKLGGSGAAPRRLSPKRGRAGGDSLRRSRTRTPEVVFPGLRVCSRSTAARGAAEPAVSPRRPPGRPIPSPAP